MKDLNYCGLSGGKDSSGAALWLIHESGFDPSTFRFTMCDTDNEAPETYEHIDYLSDYFVSQGAPPIIRLLPERGFYDLALWKGRFPSRRARFCTQFLKVIPTRLDVTSFIQADYDVVVHSGVRAAESSDRAKLVERGFSDMFGCTVNRPLLRKTLADVIAMHKRYGVKLNPLYALGFTRVGCFPCINSKKSEVRLISIHFPERIAQLRAHELELIGRSTFFHSNVVPERFRSKTVIAKDGRRVKICTIDDVVRWSHTGKGAKEIQETPMDLDFGDFDVAEDDAQLVCPSGMGMCE
jgi:3'-phosphoadenosine 5'-phosphosulfate sulfotransferase (PAPS reductase)/FAD synthetase